MSDYSDHLVAPGVWASQSAEKPQPADVIPFRARTGSAGSAACTGSIGHRLGSGGAMDELREHLGRYIRTMSELDLDLIALWIAHTHLATETYTSPRLEIDSPMPGSGKTTVLDHAARLAFRPVMAASLSSPAMLAPLLADGPRTILIDEADRSLDQKKDGVGELLAVLNSGYRRGGSRPVLVPDREQGWVAREMSTFGPVAIAGNAPNLPDDTRSRCVRVLLMPDLDGTVEESDWEFIEDDVSQLADRLAAWCEEVRETVRTARPELPDGVRGRNAEKWRPLARVAYAAGTRWPDVAAELATRDLERQQAERDEGLIVEKPHMHLIKHIAEVWPDGDSFLPTNVLLARLTATYPEMWGAASSFGRPLTPQRAGRMMANNFHVNTSRIGGRGPRGYLLADLHPVWRRLALPGPGAPPGGTGATG